MKILFVGPGSPKIGKQLDSNSLPQAAKNAGHDLVMDLVEMPEIVIFLNWAADSKVVYGQAKANALPVTLIKMEPSVVVPKYLEGSFFSKFDRVVDVGGGQGKTGINFPIDWNLNYFDSTERLDRAVAVSARKYSFVAGELYSLRAKAYSEMATIDLFGVGWDRPVGLDLLKVGRELQIAITQARGSVSFETFSYLFRRPLNYKGAASNKLLSMSQYKVALVIENSPEYMSEKLMDSLLAGNIPVYVGPPVHGYGIPSELIVSALPNLKSVQRAMAHAQAMDYGKWKVAAGRWLRLASTKKSWHSQSVNLAIIEKSTARSSG